jgi:hypothetical protein
VNRRKTNQQAYLILNIPTKFAIEALLEPLLRHVAPAAVLGGVVDLQLLGEALGPQKDRMPHTVRRGCGC